MLQKLLARKGVPADLRISHGDKSERTLAIADIVAGARSDFLCLADMGALPLIAHRVRTIVDVFKGIPWHAEALRLRVLTDQGRTSAESLTANSLANSTIGHPTGKNNTRD